MPFRLTTLLLMLAAVVAAALAFGGFGIAVTALALVVVFRARKPKSFGTMAIDMLVVLFAGLLFIGVPWLFVRLVLTKTDEGYDKRFCSNHLNQIMLALGDYHQVNGCYPPAYVADKQGRPMHSWRVLILPYLRCQSLYKQYDFNEPWDGPNNKKLLAARPHAYVCPADKAASDETATCTNYVAVVGADAAWSGAKPRKAADVAPLNQTIMLVEVTDANIPWTAPRDLCLNADPAASHEPVTVSSKHLPSGFFFHIPRPKVHVALPDGDVPFLPEELFDAQNSSNLLKVGGLPEEYLEKDWGPDKGPINWPNTITFTVWIGSLGLLLAQAFQSRKNLATKNTKDTKGGQGITDDHGQTWVKMKE